jgi:hypothetical protein
MRRILVTLLAAGACARPTGRVPVDRMNTLADLLDSMKIDGNLLTAATQIRGTLNRLEDAVKKSLPQPDLDRAEGGLRELQRIVALRTGLTHSDAGKLVPAAARSLGFEWPAVIGSAPGSGYETERRRRPGDPAGDRGDDLEPPAREAPQGEDF